jgi:hypothetical protein
MPNDMQAVAWDSGSLQEQTQQDEKQRLRREL